MPFKPGQSGNPNGRPKVVTEIRDLARSKGKEAFERIVVLMDDDDPKVSMAAAKEVLDRAYGKPAQAITGPDGDLPIELVVRWLTDDESNS